jgi:hypothetical protein
MIASGAQYDIYTLHIAQGANIVATLVCDEIAPGDRPLDPVLSVFLPDHNTSNTVNAAYYNDDGFGLDDDPSGVDCNAFDSSRVIFTATVTGVYQFRVDGFGSSTGPYTLRISDFPGNCDVMMPIPATAVGGTFVADAPTYWAPGKATTPLVTIPAGNSARVTGMDASGQYYQIIWVCDFLWVPVGTIGPNYDAVWNGAPLPTNVIVTGAK